MMNPYEVPTETNSYRARKVGIALKIQKKMEERYDAEDSLGTPKRLMNWMNQVLDGEHPPCTASYWRTFMFYLRDGVALCKLLSKLQEADGMAPVKYSTNASTAFVAMENLENFNKAAVEYGVASTAAFNSVDLYEGDKGPLLNVINCLHKLGFVANSKGYQPVYDAIEPPSRDSERWSAT